MGFVSSPFCIFLNGFGHARRGKKSIFSRIQAVYFLSAFCAVQNLSQNPLQAQHLRQSSPQPLGIFSMLFSRQYRFYRNIFSIYVRYSLTNQPNKSEKKNLVYFLTFPLLNRGKYPSLLQKSKNHQKFKNISQCSSVNLKPQIMALYLYMYTFQSIVHIDIQFSLISLNPIDMPEHIYMCICFPVCEEQDSISFSNKMYYQLQQPSSSSGL